jgi:hypothetical protein
VFDFDGAVTSNDAIIFAVNYSENAPADRRRGDLNYSGRFDSNDAILFAVTYNESLPPLTYSAALQLAPLTVVTKPTGTIVPKAAAASSPAAMGKTSAIPSASTSVPVQKGKKADLPDLHRVE